MIEVKGLRKVYHLTQKQMKVQQAKEKQKVAVAGIDFIASPGKIFGLLGPNGAGKTTTLRCAATLLKPTEGTVKVCGYDTVTESLDVRNRIAFLTNELKLDGHFTPKYTIEYFGTFYRMNPEEVERRREMLFEQFGIKPFENAKIADLSTGMKQKLSIAVSLIHDPEVVIFDEPTNGLDIITAKAVTDYLEKLKREGKTIVISTHIMSVAEKLCDELAVILEGSIVAMGTVSEVIESAGGEDLEEAFFNLYKRYAKEV